MHLASILPKLEICMNQKLIYIAMSLYLGGHTVDITNINISGDTRNIYIGDTNFIPLKHMVMVSTPDATLKYSKVLQT